MREGWKRTATAGEVVYFLSFELVDKEHRYHTHPKFLPSPSKHVSIRVYYLMNLIRNCPYIILLGGALEEKYLVVEVRDSTVRQSTHVLEDIEFSRALFELYEGGVVCVYPPPIVNYSLNVFSLCTRAIRLSYILLTLQSKSSH